jgi:predicted DNA binding CopG/RHH family protein
MKKKFPEWGTDKEAEEFIDNADLSNYDFSDMLPMKFELRPKDKAVSLRLPETLLDAVKTNAKLIGIPYQRFMRIAIEKALLNK